MPTDTRRHFLKSAGALSALAAFGLPRASFSADSVNYWHHFTSQSEMDGLATVMKQFEAKGKMVVPEGIPNAEFMSKVTTANVAGSLPDTLMVAPDRLADFVAQGAVVPVTERINGWDPAKSFPQSTWDGISINGEIYGVPAFSFVNWGYYRKDWFDEAGLEPPDTFDAFRDAAIKLTDKSKNRFGFGLRGGGGGQSYFHDVLDSFGALEYADGKASLNIDEARAAMDWYAGLYAKDGVVPESAPNDSYRQIMEGFKTGQTAMIWHHTGSLVELTDALDSDQIGTMVRQAGPAGRIARVSSLYNGLSGKGDMDLGWDWIAQWAEPDSAIALLEATGYFPASTEVAADPRITSNPMYEAAVKTLDFGIPQVQIVGFQGWLSDSALTELQKIMVGSSSVNDAVDRMARALDKAIR
jgi:multiple sugar transport system substrate-binding protein